MTDAVKILVRLLAETDGVIADIRSSIEKMPPAVAERLRAVEAEMTLIQEQIESALKKLREP
jgi:hypothetical protein